MVEESHPSEPPASEKAVSSIPVAVAFPVSQLAGAKLRDHPTVQRIQEEVGSYNNWVFLNRGWGGVCLKFTFANKLSIMANPETYSNAATAAQVWFIFEIKDILRSMPCSIEAATRCTLLWTQMLTKCKPNKEKSKTDPVYLIRGAFLEFLFQTYKACVNNRHPSRTGELKLINDFIARKVHHFIFGDSNELVYTNGAQVFQLKFPTVEDIRSHIKDKQMARDSHEVKTVARKRKSITDKVEAIYQANRDLIAVGLPPSFNSPSRLVADLVEPSPPYQRHSVNSRKFGQQQGVSSSSYAVHEDTTVWSGVSNSSSTTRVKSITKTTKVTVPSTNAVSLASQKELQEMKKRAARMARRAELSANKQQGKRGLASDFMDHPAENKKQRISEVCVSSAFGAPPPPTVRFSDIIEAEDDGDEEEEEEEEEDTLVDGEEDEEDEEGEEGEEEDEEESYNGILK